MHLNDTILLSIKTYVSMQEFGTYYSKILLYTPMLSDVSCHGRSLNFGLRLYLRPYFWYVTSERSGQSMHLRRLCTDFIPKYKIKMFSNIFQVQVSIKCQLIPYLVDNHA